MTCRLINCSLLTSSIETVKFQEDNGFSVWGKSDFFINYLYIIRIIVNFEYTGYFLNQCKAKLWEEHVFLDVNQIRVLLMYQPKYIHTHFYCYMNSDVEYINCLIVEDATVWHTIMMIVNRKENNVSYIKCSLKPINYYSTV